MKSQGNVALYAGSFNPFHKGHEDVVKKALMLFDTVHIAKYSPNCYIGELLNYLDDESTITTRAKKRIKIHTFTGLLVKLVKELKPNALIRGLRNGNDLQYEMNQLYWNEDLGIKIPTIHFICDRSLGHISSSAIREVEKMRKC